jgi:hypothetical protein
MAANTADKTYTGLSMAVVDTSTIRVPSRTQQRLAEEARLARISVTELLEKAADIAEEERLFKAEEQRLLDSLVRCYEVHGEAIRAEMKDWLDMPGPPPSDDWSDVISKDD